jgi:hypothetical protein
LKSESPMVDRITDSTVDTDASAINPVATQLGERVAQETASKCARHFGSALRAVVLTGSLARGEGSLSSDGTPGKLASDAEFVVILHDRAPLPNSSDAAKLSAEIESQLAADGVQCHVTLSCAHGDFLRKMRPHIFAYELKTCGKVLFGEQNILSLIPGFAPTDIPLEDGWRLLSNRMIEMVEGLSEAHSVGRGPVPEDVFYRAIKLNLDAATSLLIFAKNYAPSYRQRSQNISDLVKNDIDATGLPFSLKQVALLTADCTDWKLFRNTALGDAIDWQWIAIACRNASLLWEWELRKMTKAEGELSRAELCMRLMRQQPLAARIRGWLYVMRREGWKKTSTQWPRWLNLARKASPRFWVYSIIGELFVRPDPRVQSGTERDVNEPDWNTLRKCLPVLPQNPPPSTNEWQRTAKDAVWNYRQFLVDTRA